jgi:hypothetical protein
LRLQEDFMPRKTATVTGHKRDQLKQMLKQANNEIKFAMYEISRCVDSGDHHKVLTPGFFFDLQVNQCIPTSCKVGLTG